MKILKYRGRDLILDPAESLPLKLNQLPPLEFNETPEERSANDYL